MFKVTEHIAALKFCFKTCVAIKFVDDDDDMIDSKRSRLRKEFIGRVTKTETTGF